MSTYHTAPSTRNGSALTLVEVLVVILVVVLFAMFFMRLHSPSQSRHIRASAHEVVYLKLIGESMLVYAADNDGQIPPHPRYLAAFFEEDMSRRHFFRSLYQDEDAVLDRGELSGAGFRYGGYVFLALGQNMSEFEVAEETILAYSAKVSPKQIKRNVLFADGHVEQWEEEQLRAALPDGVDVDALDGP